MNRCLKLNIEFVISILLFIYFIALLYHLTEKHAQLTKIVRQVRDSETSLKNVEVAESLVKSSVAALGHLIKMRK